MTTVRVDEAAHFFWTDRVEFSHDCFVCRRLRRTVVIARGAEEGQCHSAPQPGLLVERGVHTFEAASLVHPAPIRISGWDTSVTRTEDGRRERLRCRLSFWWTPFRDVKRPDSIADALTAQPWVRLGFHVGCRACDQAGHDGARRVPGDDTLQTNTVWPVTRSCPTCERTLLTAEAGPAITLVD